jgi:SAM-dependent methyltransferase
MSRPEGRFDERYYREVCGERQTRFDRARDDRVVRMLRRHADPSGALLDVGCGYGRLLARFGDRDDLFGVVRADIQRPLPFQRRFTAVVAVNVIEHLGDPEAAIRSIGEVLVPYGVCVVHLPTINNPVSRAIYRMAYAKDPTHIYRPDAREVRALFEAAGFLTLEESYAPHSRWLLSNLRWHPAYLAAFART